MATQHSVAFVFFGATGDLAYKQVFSALQAMTRRGYLDMPVIGVAKCDGPTLCHGGRQTAHSGGDEKGLGGPADDRMAAPGTLRARLQSHRHLSAG